VSAGEGMPFDVVLLETLLRFATVFFEGPEILFRLVAAIKAGTLPISLNNELKDVALALVVTGEATYSLKALLRSMTDSFSSKEVVLNLRLLRALM
jgi:hypothetical protein